MKFGWIQGGTIRNVLAGGVTVSGSIRSYSSDMQNYLKGELAHLAEQSHPTATISLHYNGGYLAVISHEGLYTVLSNPNKLHGLEDLVPQAGDFGIYIQQYPCIFFFLSVSDTLTLHDPTFDSDMDVLEDGVEWYKAILFIENLLEKVDSSSKEERVNNDEFIQSI